MGSLGLVLVCPCISDAVLACDGSWTPPPLDHVVHREVKLGCAYAHDQFCRPCIWFGKGVFWKRGLFRKVHFLEILKILDNPYSVENKGDSDQRM